MKNRTALAVFFAAALAFSAPPGRAGDSALFHLQVSDQTAENGKMLNMRYQELAREADASTVEVTFISGGSVSSSMFVLRGSCGVARARGENYFRAEQLSKAPNRFRLQFVREATQRELHPQNIKEKVFSVAECALLGF